MGEWVSEHLETIVLGGLTLVGFGLQYWHFECKISVRDRRDVFHRMVSDPLDRLRTQFVDFGAHLSAASRKGVFDVDQVFETAIRLSRQFNALTKQLNQSPSFDVENGWIGLSTERFDDAIFTFDQDQTADSVRVMEAAARELFEKTDRHYAACSIKARIDKAH